MEKDVTTTSFGLIIAYLLPGLAGLYGLTFWFEPMRNVLLTFFSAKADFALALIVVAVALTLGLLVNAVRFLVYERLICRTVRLSPENFARLMAQTTLAAFTTVIEENMRYHQFFGSMTIIMPVVAMGLIKYYDAALAADGWFVALSAAYLLSMLVLSNLLYEMGAAASGLKQFLCKFKLTANLIGWLGLRKARRITWAALVAASSGYGLWVYFHAESSASRGTITFFVLGLVMVEIATGAAAIAALRRYVDRTNYILGGVKMPNGRPDHEGTGGGSTGGSGGSSSGGGGGSSSGGGGGSSSGGGGGSTGGGGGSTGGGGGGSSSGGSGGGGSSSGGSSSGGGGGSSSGGGGSSSGGGGGH